ncbi:MAG TPA: excinuclease ABC subunit A [Blastocatellia bacterium]|nr:excinuclease ABC subunit A [Blastocatellia bacterium]
MTCAPPGDRTRMADDFITVRGARVHNLKNASVDLPLGRLTVITGVSGSGKSSLAFDTLYAEGQRRFVESLSAYARQFLERMDKPDVDEITGICPPIAIRQKNSTRNPRSTVATQTEIYDYLRLFFSRIGTTFCRNCSREVTRDTPESIADQVLQLADGTRFYVMFPASAGMADEPGPHSAGSSRRAKSRKSARASTQDIRIKAHLMSLLQRGFNRLVKDGQVIELETPDSFAAPSFDNTYVLVDRLIASPAVRSRLVDSLEVCYQEGHGQAVIETRENPVRHSRYSEGFECKDCSLKYPTPEPRLFSFNSPFGACPTCQGFGNTIGLDPELIIPNRELTIAGGAIEPWTKPQYDWAQRELLKYCRQAGIPTNVPFRDLTRDQQNAVMKGRNGFDGVLGFFDWLETKKYKLHVRVFLSKYRGYTVCPDCSGGRLRREAALVRVAGKTLPEVCAMTAADASTFIQSLELTPMQSEVAGRLVQEIRDRLKFLLDVGLDYLTLDRLASTLSGGESQRIQLATNLGASLVGALYVLDEPSIGLHPRDNQRLIRILQNLRDIGNTVLVVEHEPEMILSADRVIDIGPGAGELGGEVIFSGTPDELMRSSSLTGKYLRGELEIKSPRRNSDRKNGEPAQASLLPETGSGAAALKAQSRRAQILKIKGAREHNLKAIDVDFPLGKMVCVTGVSGSGKSTLVHDVLYAALKKQRGEWTGPVGGFSKIEGAQLVDSIVLVDQTPIGRTPRSNPVTYIKAYDAIRDLFASTREAQSRGYDASFFSFNVPGGRCERCEGNGMEVKEMQFLADVELVCEECKGARFKPALLDVRYKGRSINDVLNMTVREALGFFAGVNRIAARLRVLDDVGLGYLRLGQSATTLSGGEAQRVKLASHLSKKAGEHTLYIFDEPTTGLHFDDINKLLVAFRHLIEADGSIIIIEHNLDVIKCADWIVDLGPEGGERGGEIVVVGPPSAVLECPESYTGHYLGDYLRRQSGSAVA